VAPSVRAACAACVTDNQADNSHSTGIMHLRVITVRYQVSAEAGPTERVE